MSSVPENTIDERPRGSVGLLFLLAWIPYATLTAKFWWLCDDAYIAFRFARNWGTGNGLRFNLGAGPPIEGFSDFLWIAVCAGLEFLGADMTIWPTLVSFLSGSILLGLVIRTLRDRLQLERATTYVAALFLGCCPSFFIWSTGGLETVPYALALFLTFHRLILHGGGIAPVSAGLAGLSLALVREEGIYWVLLMAGLAFVSRLWIDRGGDARGQVRALVTYLGIVAVGYAIYWTCRFQYFGHPFSNTAMAKVGVTAATLDRGLSYVVSHLLTLPSLLVVLPGLLFALRPDRRAIGLPVAVMSAATLVYPIVVSGDFLPMGRLLVIGLPFHTLLFAWTLESLGGTALLRGTRAHAVGALLVGASLLAALDLHLVPVGVRDRFHFRGSESEERRSEYEQWERIRAGTVSLVRRGKALADYMEPGDTMVTGAIGCIAYFSGIYIYDQNGLVTRSVSTRDRSGEPLRKPGHDMHVPETFFLDQEPTYMGTGICAADEVAQRFERWAGTSLASQYVPDFAPLRSELRAEGAEYLVVLRRMDPGQRADVVWSERLRAARSLGR